MENKMDEQMDENHVVYLGRKVTKENFRVFMYNKESEKKLVNSWIEYEAFKATGNWFSTQREAIDAKYKVPDKEILKDAIVKITKARK